MSDVLKFLAVLARDTVTDPKGGARQVLDLPLPREALWPALALVVVLGMLQTFAYDAVMSAPADPIMPAYRATPLLTTAVAFVATLLMVVAMHRVGLLFGGTGDFEGALRLTIWLQAVMLIFNLIQLVLLVVLPPLAALMGAVNLGLMLWLLTNFVAVLHGFRALFPVFMMIIATGFVLGLVLFFLLMLTGVMAPMEMANV